MRSSLLAPVAKWRTSCGHSSHASVPTRRSPQNERDETQLKPKSRGTKLSESALALYCLCIGRRTRSGHGIRSRWWAPPAQRLHLLGEGHHTQSRPSGAGQKKSPAASTAGVGAGAGPRSPAIRCASRTRHRLRNRETSGTSGPMRPNILIGSTGNHEVGVCYSCFDAGGGQQHRSIPTPSSNPASRASDSGPWGRVLFCIYRNHCWAGPVYDTKNAGCMTHSKTMLANRGKPQVTDEI